jgi:F-type H+-transporting ATPase subunit b
MFALNILVYKPIRSVLLQRKEKVDGLDKGIEKLLGEVKGKNEVFSSGIKAARAEGLNKKESLIQAAADEEKAIIGRINQKAKDELAVIQQKIANDAQIVRSSLLEKTDEFANDISEKILGRAV